MKHTILGLFLLVVTVPLVSHAGPIIRSGETVSVDATQTLAGDFYGFAPSLTISGNAENDVHVAGGTIAINAPIGGDLTAAGGLVQVFGDVGDDVRIIAGDVTIAKTVHGDVVMMGGILNVLSTATIEGDLLFMGGELNVEGTVKGTMHGTADTIRINALVEGDASLVAETLVSLGDNAIVQGDVRYKSRNDLVRAQNAQVLGDIQRTELRAPVEENLMRSYLLFASILLFASLSLYFLGRRSFSLIPERTQNLGVTGLVGLAAFIVTPFLGMVLLVSVIGSLLGLLLLFAYAVLLVLSLVTSGLVVAHLLEKLFMKKAEISLMSVVMGTAIFCALPLVPYLGGLLMFATLMIALGSLMMLFYRGVRP